MSEAAFQKGLDQYQAGDYEAAIVTFKGVLEIYPHHSEVWLNLGNVYFKLNVLEQAEKHWKKAVDLNPLETKGYLNLGNLFFSQQRYKEAVHFWEVSKKLDAKQKSLWLNLGIAYENLGDPNRAFDHYGHYMSLDSGSVESVKLKTRMDRARENFKKAIKVAESAMKKGMTKKAMDAFQTALPTYPGNEKMYKAYASLLYQKGRIDEALDYYLRAYKSAPKKDSTTLTNLGVIFEKKGQSVDALWAYYLASQSPSANQTQIQGRFDKLKSVVSVPSYFKQAQLCFETAQYHDAEEKFYRLLDLGEYSGVSENEIRQWLEKIHLMQDPLARAKRTYYNLGINAEEKGKFDQAMAFYAQYLDVAPQGAEAQDVQQRLEKLKTVAGAIVSSLLGTEAETLETLNVGDHASES